MSGVAYNGIEKIDVKGKDILIIGAGAIGLLGAACAKALGKLRVQNQTSKVYSTRVGCSDIAGMSHDFPFSNQYLNTEQVERRSPQSGLKDNNDF